MRKTSVLLMAVFCALPLVAEKAPKEEWVQLFNGRDLKGWTPKITGYKLGDNFGNTFRVRNGVMAVSYEKYEKFDNRFGHIFYKRKLHNYRLAVEYRFTGEQAPGGPEWAFRNSGIMLFCQAPETMGKDQDFPISVEYQLLGGHETGDRPTASVCTPGTNIEIGGKLITAHCITSTAKTYRGDQWVRVEAEVRDGHVRHIIDGMTVLEYDKPQIGGGSVTNFDPAVKKDGTLLTEGYISLQSESHPVEFRKVELLELR